MSQTNHPCIIKLQIQIKPQVAPLHSQPKPTRLSLQTEHYTLTMPVQHSYDTEAAQLHLPAHPAPCVRLPTLSICSPRVPGAWLLYTSLTVGSLCLIQHDTLHGVVLPPAGNLVVRRQETYWDGPTTSRKPMWFGERKPLWLALFVLLMGNPCGSLTILSIMSLSPELLQSELSTTKRHSVTFLD